MKTFFSYSSKDRTLAKGIVEKLSKMGVEVFFDEKSLETGDNFHEEIQNNIRNCCEFLILLSPASVKNAWVQFELGGAMILKKRIVPILNHVEIREMPEQISKNQARDVNDIEKYYSEVRRRLRKSGDDSNEPRAKPEPKAARSEIVPFTTAPRKHSFKVGDKVTVVDASQPTARRDLYDIDWSEVMNDYLGKTGKVTQVDPDGSVKLDIDNGDWWWAVEWLQLVDGD